MNYELAKKLKDAGFPQNMDRYHYDGKNNQTSALDEDGIDFPTLSELIEACGDEIIGISKYNNGEYAKDGWYAMYHKPAMSNTTFIYGSTPEEAVANLWIQLHTNK